MELTSLIVQLLGGIAAGHAVGKGVREVDLGFPGNALTGAVGGICGAHLLQVLVPPFAASGGVDLAVLAAHLVVASASGAMLTAVVGLARSELREAQQA
jgi:hypothetical protein